MRTITLEFASSNELEVLLSDQSFIQEITFLNPVKLDYKRLVVSDHIEYQSPLDSEVVVLSIFSRAIKRLLFPNTKYQIEFIIPFVNEQKGGLHHNGYRVISSTVIQQF